MQNNESAQTRFVAIPNDEGDQILCLFDLLLAALKQPRSQLNNSSYADRMGEQFKWPRVVHCPEKFHQHYWMQFSKFCNNKWHTMTSVEKHKFLRAWLFLKFTMDPNEQVMDPEPGSRRKISNVMSWRGFWLSDEELDCLVKEVLPEY